MKRGIFLIIAMASALLCCIGCKQSSKEVAAQLYATVDEKPRFLDGEPNSFAQWVYSELKYPQSALEQNITGKVTVSFTIAKDGSMTNIEITEHADPVLEKEVMRVISKAPKWTPGKSDSKPVDVKYIFPIVFDNKKAFVPETDPTVQPAIFISPDSGKSGHVEFIKWFFYRVEYPLAAKEEGIMGRGKLAFEITETGELEHIRVVQGAHPLLDSAAIKVVRESPKWKPATKDGIPIKTTYIFPYVFQLR